MSLFISKINTSLSLIFALLIPSTALAEIHVSDDAGNKLSFPAPLKRIISLSPHSTELLFSAGAEQQILGTVSYSDYPEAAKKIPRVGGYNKFDLERIIALQPEVVITWPGGNPNDQLDELKKLGIKTYVNEPKQFKDIARSIINMGKLLGTEKKARATADQFLKDFDALQEKYQNRTPVNVFYQVWNDPLMTISADHLVTQVIDFCGGKNVFANLPVQAPRISIESVLEKDPEVIIAGMTHDRKEWFAQWQKWQSLSAVKNHHVYPINAELIIRQTPRVLKGTEIMCEILDRVREHQSRL